MASILSGAKNRKTGSLYTETISQFFCYNKKCIYLCGRDMQNMQTNKFQFAEMPLVREVCHDT
jgi:hypothetical protein